jgi:hypothetical protein
MKPDWSIDDWREVAERLHRRLAHAHEGLNFRVELANPGELPRFELKAKRTLDLRDQTGAAGAPAGVTAPAGAVAGAPSR